MPVDFVSLRAAIQEAARQAFFEVRQNHPHETFYAFALYSDDSAMTVEPAANSEKALQRQIEAGGESAGQAWLRWGTAEWDYEGTGSEYFSKAYKLININDQYDESEVGAFEAFRNEVFATMVQALSDLDANGFFGTGAEREAITLFCSISDSEDTEQFENNSAKMLNSPAIYKKFAARWD